MRRQYDWRNPNSVLIVQDSTDRSEAKVFRAHVPHKGVCENLMNADKFLANQQIKSDSLAEVPVQGLQERSRSEIVDELRR